MRAATAGSIGRQGAQMGSVWIAGSYQSDFADG
jgi:hypothetical protein